jgi:adenosylhomocysteine nucleosidase
MKILVTFAVEAEFAPWRSKRRFRRRQFRTPSYGSSVVHSATIDNATVDVFLTGIALRNQEPGLSVLLDERPDVCITCGLAGALHHALKREEIVVARHVGALTRESRRSCDGKLVEMAAQNGATAVDTFFTSEHILSTAQAKREGAQYGDVVEMESLAILTKTSQRWIPTVAVRAISDTADEDLPLDFDRCTDSRGEISSGRLIVQMARRPSQLPALVAFGKGSRRAAIRLAEFLDHYITVIQSYSFEGSTKPAQVAAR